MTILKGFFEGCLSLKASVIEDEPPEILIHFTEEDAKNQIESFKVLQFFIIA